RERSIIVVGALMIACGIAGFAYTIPTGSIPLILLCALLQGGGFGVAWPFLTRVIVASAREGEQTIASAAVPIVGCLAALRMSLTANRPQMATG
ncbi:MAG: MFS transporter, partial [Mesorhizobium sp.]